MNILLWLIGGDWLELKLVMGVALIVAILWFFRGSSVGIGIAATVATILGANLLARQGWKRKEAKDMKDAEKLIRKAGDARTRADRLSADPKRLRDDDGFRRD